MLGRFLPRAYLLHLPANYVHTILPRFSHYSIYSIGHAEVIFLPIPFSRSMYMKSRRYEAWISRHSMSPTLSDDWRLLKIKQRNHRYWSSFSKAISDRIHEKNFDENTPLFLNKRALIGQEQISLDLPCPFSISSKLHFHS